MPQFFQMTEVEKRYSQKEYEAKYVYGHNGLTRKELDRLAKLDKPQEEEIREDTRSPWEKPDYDWREEKDYS